MTTLPDTPIEITPQVLLKAYACGIFPMAEDAGDSALYWIDPEKRGVLPLDGFHLPRRLKRTLRSGRFEVRVDTAFAEVLASCAKPMPGRGSTWINTRIRQLYTELHRLGHCHSVEAWHQGELAGGLYGIRLGGAFFGESMFSTRTDASKITLVHLIARLIAGGFTLLDTQFVTGHLARFGAIEIPRAVYQQRLDEALAVHGDFFELPPAAGPGEVLQVLSQTS
ncbi:Leucyl/phenylalanyl-tRNA--protein transferase [hydrothermal vent metagenome]|uniref:Leucyl/phenylalanyl-tRNA--protein transferase n=1 Tax=hydrothermal vent metagenome TaxID=652676 RepID=A0A3B0U7J8_9ZZZZ